MNMFIWNYVSDLTQNYHNGGALIIVAKDLTTALSDLKASGVSDVCEAHSKAPNRIYNLSESEVPSIMIFKDSGCC